jgi:cytochrome oxidase Cu insertion factor (SCO1/SenC/PrrC family)
MLDVVEMESLAQACFAKTKGDGGYGLVGEHIESLCEDLKVDRPTKQDAHDTIVHELNTIIVAANGLLSAIRRGKP